MAKLNKLSEPQPLLVQPTIAKVFGLREAIFLQQLHERLDCSDDKKGVAFSYSQWQEILPFISVTNLKRIIKKLKDLGILIVRTSTPTKRDRTTRYAIDYLIFRKYLDEKLANSKKI